MMGYGSENNPNIIQVDISDEISNQLRNASDGNKSDFVNSWWCLPRSLYNDLRGCFYQGGVNREGMMQITKFDLRRRSTETVDLGKYEKDDHNVPAFLFEDDKNPIVAIVRHAKESFVRIRIGSYPHNLKSLEAATEVQLSFPNACTYAHLIRRPTDSYLALLTRCSDGWYVRISFDWGKTWSPARRFHAFSYCTFKQVGHRIKYAITNHPISSVDNEIRYFEIDTVSGDVYDSSLGTPIENLWNGTAVIGSNKPTLVGKVTDPETLRTFDVGRNGSIAAMKFDKTNPQLGGTYGVYRFKNSATWDWEPITHSGIPVGYYQSSYVGGVVFGGNDDSVWLARESSGVWSMENWKKVNGVWGLSETIKLSSDGKLGRPQIPWGAEGTGLFTGIEYWRYATDTYEDYYGDQMVIKTDISENVVASPTLPTVNEIPISSSFQLLTQGSLLLVDAPKWTAGVPNSTVPNLVDGSTLAVVNSLTSADGVAERTSLGGLHVAVSQTSANLGRTLGLDSQAIRDYMAANPNNSYFIALSAVVTRQSTFSVPVSAAHKMFGMWGTSKSDSLNIRPVTNNKVSIVPSAHRTFFTETATPAPLNTPFIVDGSVSKLPSVGTDINLVRFGTGPNADNVSSGLSWILYGAYIEDLTASGRSYDLVSRIFKRDFAPSKFTTDTYTNPSTLVT